MPATAAHIPPELLPRILDFVGTNDKGWALPWERREGESLRDLKSCSLVSLHWANQCRDVLLGTWARIKVRSLEEMKSLEFYAKHGSERLVLTPDLIQQWCLEQTWASRSWCHVRYNSSFCTKNVDEDDLHADGLALTLAGPVPSSLPVSVLHSPHWSLPRSLPACHTPFTCLQLSAIHFPSLSSLAKLLRHFRFLSIMYLEKITWDDNNVHVFSPFARASVDHLCVIAEGCSHNEMICNLAQLVLSSGSPFGQLQMEEREASLALIDAVHHLTGTNDFELAEVIEDDRDPPFVSDKFYIDCPSESTCLVHIYHNLHSTHEQKEHLDLHLYALTIPTIPPHPSSTHIVALLLSLLADTTFASFCLPSLKACVDQLPSLRLVALSFYSLSDMEDATCADRTLRTPLSVSGYGEITYRFLCSHLRDPAFADIPEAYGLGTWVEIDPIVMQPTGQTWNGRLDDDTILENMVKKYHPGLLP